MSDSSSSEIEPIEPSRENNVPLRQNGESSQGHGEASQGNGESSHGKSGSSRLPGLIDEVHKTYQGEAREYRQFLQSMMRKVLWSIYIVASVLVLVPTFLGITTFFGIKTQITNEVSKSVEKIVNKEFVDDAATRALQRKQDSMVVMYWLMRLKKAEQAFSPEQISHADLLSIGRVLDDPSSWAFEDALAMFSYCRGFSEEFSQKYEASVLRHLNQEWQSDYGVLDESKEQMVIRGLANCRDENIYNLFMFAIESDSVGMKVRETALLHLPRAVPYSEKRRAGDTVLDMAEDSRKELRGFMLAVAMMLSPKATAPHIMRIADKDRPSYISALTVLIDEATKPGDTFIRSDLASLSNVLAAYLGDNEVSLIFESRNIGAQPAMHVAIDGERCGVALTPQQLYSKVMQRAIAKVIKECSSDSCQKLLRRIVVPIAELGAAIYEREQAEGRLGYAADPFTWRDGFFLTVDGEDMLLNGCAEDSISLLRRTGKNQPPVSLSRPVSEIRLNSAEWRIQSVGYGR